MADIKAILETVTETTNTIASLVQTVAVFVKPKLPSPTSVVEGTAIKGLRSFAQKDAAPRNGIFGWS